ncbi:probable caffeoyl-CoA O-methyltransferase 1 isoform X3 [Dendrobium catenatum]|uniref:probable caffeoyl-CoA O-methyltransferase 1 isoform X3 n=1 Tax=Dendrobium catenatum TaxID=906689 RepID=UPI0010A0412B|nr:probable caffeoyl-CoA O-methyltransferase 1 isoform X3 [Dendrobium catenatum]
MAISPPSPFSLKPLPKLVSPGCQSEKLPQSFIFPRLTQLSLASRRTHAVEPAAAVPVVELEDEKYGKKQVISLSSGIYEYVLANVREPPVLRDLREETAGMRGSQMQGYSSLAIALALPDSGSLVACERDANCLEIAKKYYVRAGVSHKVEIKHALAVDTLEKLIQNGESCSYDFAFVDAEKRMYDEYYELLLQLVRFGGVIIFDNVLWHGKVSDPQVKDSKTMSLRNFNKKILSDNRVSISMVPIGDGMTICRKRE